MKTTAVEKILRSHNTNDFSFTDPFISIIVDKCDGYDGSAKDKLKSFFEDLQHGGCMSGMIGDFIYHSDNKAFYVEHIDDLEEYMSEMEDSMGEAIHNRHNLVRYTFVVWVCFEEFCFSLYNSIFG
jgi:homoserine acetyltransferase